MDSNADFASLVSAHRRLMEKYGQASYSYPLKCTLKDSSTTEEACEQPYRRPEAAPWTDMSHATTPRKLPYPTSETTDSRCCPRCHFSMETKSSDVLPTLLPKTTSACHKGFAPAFPADGMLEINQMLSLQLASMEYARLLSALRTGSCLAPPFYHDQANRSYMVDPAAGEAPRDLLCETNGVCALGRRDDSSMRVPHKRKDYESEADAVSTQRTVPVKRTRLVWTKDLHERFVAAVEKLGIDKAVPKAILEAMDVDGLTRENVASHLQKYRLQLMQSHTNTHPNAEEETEKSNVARSSTIHGSSAFTESESTGSVTHNTGDFSTTAMPEPK